VTEASTARISTRPACSGKVVRQQNSGFFIVLFFED
jgi:hypothetical protein